MGGVSQPRVRTAHVGTDLGAGGARHEVADGGGTLVKSGLALSQLLMLNTRRPSGLVGNLHTC